MSPLSPTLTRSWIGFAPGLQQAKQLLPGVVASCVVAAASTFLSEHYGAPVMLFALLLGLAMNFLGSDGPCEQGIAFTSRHVLRWGVALLGLRITLDQVASLGWSPIVLVVVSVCVTIAVSMLVARLLGFQAVFGLLSGGATAICGASAAMALAASLPNHPLKERATLFTVIGVSALSTLCMVLYPMLAHVLGLSPVDAGVFIGGTIHDVAQVVGAGYSISQEAGDVATVVKLMRVAMLLPVILFSSMVGRMTGQGDAGERPPILPWFAVCFALLMVVNSTGWVPQGITALGHACSRWFMVAAISAIGMKTQLKQLTSVGLKPVLLMLGETLFMATLVLLLSHGLQ